MHEWRAAFSRALRSGTCASLFSSAALVLTGWWWKRRPAAPSNGPSQWLWGARGAHVARFTWRHTVTGYAIHHAASVFWAIFHERLLALDTDDCARRAAKGLATAVTAAAVDYRMAPRRLQPGFDKHLPPALIGVVYLAFGAGLALAARGRPAPHVAEAARSAHGAPRGVGVPGPEPHRVT